VQDRDIVLMDDYWEITSSSNRVANILFANTWLSRNIKLSL